MGRTDLLAAGQITADDVREMDFPAAVFGGYRTDAVNRFLGRVAAELDKLHAALDERADERARMAGELKRLQGKLQMALSGPQERARPAPPPDTGQQAARVLQAAQGNADAMLADARQRAQQVTASARHEHDTIIEHARQQAGAIIGEATHRASAEYDRAVSSATAEARRQVAFYTALAGSAGEGLRAEVEALFRLITEWDEQARSGAGQAMAGSMTA
jgi:DivIVA domain-containing protein